MGTFGYIVEIIKYISIVMGVAMTMFGMFKLKRYSEMRSMMSQQMTLSGPLMLMVCGALLLSLPTTIEVALFAFWGDSSIMHYPGLEGVGAAHTVVMHIYTFLRVIGLGSFIRGIILISRAGGGSGQPGTLSKGFIHIFGGILAINIEGTIHILRQIAEFF